LCPVEKRLARRVAGGYSSGGMDLDTLRTVPMLRELSDKQLAGIAQLFSVKEHRPGEQLIGEGEPVNALRIILSGAAHVRRKAQKRDVLLGRLGACGIFGEINLFDPGLATASVVAATQLTVAEIDYEVLRGFMAQNPEAGYRIVTALMAEVCSRLRQTNQRFVQSVYWSNAG
jgi:CRP-like cAMP-binding protein